MDGLKFLLGAIVSYNFLSAHGYAAELSPSPHKSTNMTVESSQLEPFSIDKKSEPKYKPDDTYSSQNAGIDVNENGEPNLNMRF